jgi:hypothetical protein
MLDPRLFRMRENLKYLKSYAVPMSGDGLSGADAVIIDPLRQRILLKMGQHDSVSFEDLTKSLKLTDSTELCSQLRFLQETTVGDEHIVTQLANSKFQLTEKGHAVVNRLIICPPKSKPKWFTPYWTALFALTILVVGVLIPLFTHQSAFNALVYTAIALGVIGLGYYSRTKSSVTLNKLAYVGLVGLLVGVILWFAGLFIALSCLPNTEEMHNVVFVVLTGFSFTVGPLIGYLIGKARNFKGPEPYSA